MNRKQAKDMLPIIQALAEGKHIQLKDRIDNWIDIDFINVEICNPNVYRIKPELKYHPFANAEECWQEMQKHQPFGWLCNIINNQYYYITALDDYGVVTIPFNRIEYTKYTDIIKRKLTFADGTPFGIKEE